MRCPQWLCIDSYIAYTQVAKYARIFLKHALYFACTLLVVFVLHISSIGSTSNFWANTVNFCLWQVINPLFDKQLEAGSCLPLICWAQLLNAVEWFWLMEPNFYMLMWVSALLQMWFMLMLLSRNYSVSCGLLLMFVSFVNTVMLEGVCWHCMWGLWTWWKLCCHIVL
jgi:hypothetical protein